jgi:pimeloyl-ACP methyl ester carboxylesterase
MRTAIRELSVPRESHALHTEVTQGPGTPLVLLHGFPDSTHLYDRLHAQLAGRRHLVRFDFLGWGRSDKPRRYAYTAANQVGDIDAVVRHLGYERVVLVAHDASGPPAIAPRRVSSRN